MPGKPKITDDHLKKYESIMGTPTTSRFSSQKSTSPPPSHKAESKWIKSSFISNLPKPSDISNKMFIFTGKKKIIVDGGEKEVEKVKTVDTAENKETHEEIAKVPTSPATSKEAPAPNKTPAVEMEKEKKDTNKHTNTSIKKMPKSVVILFFFIFLGAWILFWMVFFGYVKL